MTYPARASDTYRAKRGMPGYLVSMAFKDELRKAMDDAGVDHGGLAKLLNISRPAVTQWLSGATTPKGARIQQIAEALGVTVASLFSEEDADQSLTVPVVGYVGAGTEVFPIDDAPLGGGLEHVEAPPGSNGTLVAVIVRGTSMVPAFWEGDLLFYTRDAAFDREECLYQECVVKVLDGPTYVKVIRPGRTATTFTLESFNSTPIMDVEIEWAAPVLHINRTRRRARSAMEVLAKTKKRKAG